jgi:fumarylacetoacetase
VVVSGTPCIRPWGQSAPTDPKVSLPNFAPAAKLDFELEVGFFVGPGNEVGHSIAPDQTEDQMFGLCLVNDWSARDIQRWENQPLGPFLAKSFLTTISPWVITLEALAPFRVAAPPRDVPLLPHLRSDRIASAGAFDIELQATLSSASMRERGLPAHVLARPAFRNQYWTLFQMLAHHASNGCNLRPGDLIASGTVSDVEPSESGCMLELTRDGRQAIAISGSEERTYLVDADEIEFTGRCRREGFRAIGFGSCRGRVHEAASEAAMVPRH